MNNYRALPDNLKGYADTAKKYLSDDLGLAAMNIESEIDPSIEFRPTLSAISNDKHIICAEVVDKLFSPEVEHFVLDCKNKSVPVKLYVVVGKGEFQAYDAKALKFARDNGIAILEVAVPNVGQLMNGLPLSLSLGGLRSFTLTDYPKKYRESLKHAIETFKSGNPSKGCSDVYDEIEQLTRRLANKASSFPNALKKKSGFDFNKGPWHSLLEFLNSNLDRSVIGCQNLNGQLFNRLIGLTEFRNESGHKPSSLKKRIERDKQLRTRFESAMDELLTLINATKSLRI